MKQEEKIHSIAIEQEIIEPQFKILFTTDEDDELPVYISGNFNQWKTLDSKFQMH
jgi:hypothetical protein